MVSREFRVSDIPEISKIYEKQPELSIPGLINILGNRTFVDGDRVIGYGVVNLFAEATLIVDGDISKRQKAEVVRSGLESALNACKKQKVGRLYVITSYPRFADILIRHYHAKVCEGHTLLIEAGE